MSLDDQLRALCEEHGLTALSLTVCRRADGYNFFSATAHGGEISAGSGYQAEQIATPAAAIKSAIENLNAKRTKTPVISELEAA